MAASQLDSSDVRLLEAVLAEFSQRCRQGETPDVEQYVQQYPHLSGQIREALPALKTLHDLTPSAARRKPPSLDLNRPEQIGDYHVVREIGRGGMGIVYYAVQQSLDRPVALKVLPQRALLDAVAQERFRREALIAAQLHHTNIVPVFGAGQSEDVLYLSMQYIEGESLDRVIRALRGLGPQIDASGRWKSLPPHETDRFHAVARRLLEGRLAESSGESPSGAPLARSEEQESQAALAIDIAPSSNSDVTTAGYWGCVATIGIQAARALAHAHARGVLHRDVKPSNLILDRDGTVWVTDFGLARQGEQSELTSAGDLVGTLRYIAPERFRGEIDERTDIYSLGLTLYELLTLHPPFGEPDRQVLMRRIVESEPPAPRTLRPAIPRDLETIVLKAIAKEPERRYRTAADLADDLERFLEGRPVAARPLGAIGRGWRWCRRNPVVAILAASLLSVLASGLTSVTWQWQRAERSLAVAARQRDRAEQNFLRARQVVDDYLTTISEGDLLDVPTLEPLRAELLRRAKQSYEGFIEDRADDLELHGELAATYIRLGQITHDLDGDWLPIFEQGIAMLEQLEDRGAAFAEFRSWREGVYNSRAGWLHNAKSEEVLPIVNRAVVIWTRLVRAHPDVPGFRSDLAGLYQVQGMAHLDANRRQPALAAFEESRQLRDSLVQQQPDIAKFQYGLGESYAMLGVLYLRQNALDEALSHTTRAKELLTPLARDNPSATKLADILAAVHQRIAAIRLRQGRPTEAFAEFQQALAIQQRLANEYPYVPQFQENLAFSYRSLGRSLFAAGHIASAEGVYDECVALLERRSEGYPEQVQYRRMLAETLIELGRYLTTSQQPEAAESAARRALLVIDEGDSTNGLLAAQAHYRVARALFDRGVESEMVEHFESAIALGRASVATAPSTLAEWIYQFGRALQQIGRIDEAEQAYREALELRLANGATTNGVLAMNHFRLATALEELDRTDEADTLYCAALGMFRSAGTEGDQVHLTLDRLLDMHRSVADWQRADAILAEHREFHTRHIGVTFGGPWSVSIFELPPNAKVEAAFAPGELDQHVPHCMFETAAVDFRWLSHPPRPDMPAARFALAAESELTLAAGEYRVHLDCQAGARVFIDDRLVMDQSVESIANSDQAIHSSEGMPSQWRVEFVHTDGPARLRLWLSPLIPGVPK